MRIAFIVLLLSCSMLLLSAAEHLQMSRKLYVWHKQAYETELRLNTIIDHLQFSQECSLEASKLPTAISQDIFAWLENSPPDYFCMQESQRILVRYLWVKSGDFALLYLVGRTTDGSAWVRVQKLNQKFSNSL